MSTARDLIKGALKLIGVVAEGEAPSAGQQTDGLAVFNDMLDAWSIEDLIVYFKTTEDFSLIPGQADYGMGPTGDFNTTRPLGIDGVSIIDGTAEFQVEKRTLDQWMCIQNKTVQSTLPTKFYFNETFPLATISLWPVPSETKTIRVYSWKALTGLAAVGDTVSFPPGYAQALKYNLAVLLAPEYGRPIDQVVAGIALDSKANIKRKNIKTEVMGMDSALRMRRRFNILRGN